VIVDSTGMTLEQVVERAEEIIEAKLGTKK
jgi:hypothetical protein